MEVAPDIMLRLMGDGVTAKWYAEHLGIRQKEAARRLAAAGAYKAHNGQYRMPNPARKCRALGGRACFPSVTNGSVFTGRDRY